MLYVAAQRHASGVQNLVRWCGAHRWLRSGLRSQCFPSNLLAQITADSQLDNSLICLPWTSLTATAQTTRNFECPSEIYAWGVEGTSLRCETSPEALLEPRGSSEEEDFAAMLLQPAAAACQMPTMDEPFCMQCDNMLGAAGEYGLRCDVRRALPRLWFLESARAGRETHDACPG